MGLAVIAVGVAVAVMFGPAQALAQTTFEVRVSANDDDAEEDSSNGTMYLNSSDLELANDGNYDTVGIRFTAVTVPKDVTITNAYVQFKVDETSSGSVSLTIWGQDIDDAATFNSNDYNLSGRTKTSASVAWSPPAWNTVGEAAADQRTPDISSIIQEIIDRPGWTSGNDLVIIIRGTGTRTAESHDGDSGGAPRLHIEHDGEPLPTYYVRPDGDDGNTGTGPTAAEAWQTVREATRQNVLLPGDIIYVMAGSYTERIQPDEDGTSGLPIRVIADVDGTVSVWPAGDVILQHNGEKVIDLDGDDYWSFEGFTIAGKSDRDAVRVKNSLGAEFHRCHIYGGDTGFRAESNAELTITNCRIHDCTDQGVYVKNSGCDVTVWNSTIGHNGGDGIEQDNGTLTVTNSIILSNGDDGFDRNGGTMTHTYNLSYGNSDSNWTGTTKHASELETDPLLTDTANRDYHLQSTSPAINAGTSAAGTVDDDFDRNNRPIGASWDLGAYEYVLLGHWELNDGSGLTASDSSGNGNDGTLQSGTSWEPDRCSYAVKLDGSSDWIDLAQIAVGTKSYSASAWFKTTRAAEQTIFAATSSTSGSDHLMYLGLDAQGHVEFVHRSPVASSGGTTLTSTDTYRDGSWHHVVAVKSTSQLLLYVDGALVDWSGDTTSVHSPVDVVLGRHGVSLSQRYFRGSIDEVKLYGSAFSGAVGGTISDVTTLLVGIGAKSVYWDGMLDDFRIYGRALCADEIDNVYHSSMPRGVRIIKWVEIK